MAFAEEGWVKGNRRGTCSRALRVTGFAAFIGSIKISGRSFYFLHRRETGGSL